MKYLQLIGLIVCAAFVASCETIQTTGARNQEAKRLAAVQQEARQTANSDEGEQNLWSAQGDRLNRDSNPAIRY
jgi:hypothetical protein